MNDTGSTERREKGERRSTERRGLLKRRSGPGRRIWILRDPTEEASEENSSVSRGTDRRAEPPRRSEELRRADQRRRGDRRLD